MAARLVRAVFPSLLEEGATKPSATAGGCCPATSWPKLEADASRKLA
eukprot:CAMPEP_0206048014 /NCGR_PEP_ID=MMETSP1466-20131121/22935_1 /ASSEMBLY_ACC=CAM_ASM_001126 /TAXON_ID=44452 /ORGANISM="Pavlova gyrans, Strain CCMP608" /LENGTH=46 /DNA_ID= /DNA_START= /DNA_END= /DNA_ORIENTATION=